MTGYAFALSKNSKYKEIIDRKLIELMHSGELERTTNFWFTGSCKNKNENANSEGLGVPQAISVFILLFIGIIIGLSVFLVHHFYNRHVMNKLKRSVILMGFTVRPIFIF
jgi:hypothetical protein